MKTESKTLENGDLQIILTFDAHDQACLNHDLVSIVDWYASGPSQEKIYNCRKRMMKEHQEQLMKSPEMASKTMGDVNEILSNPVKCVEAICKMPGYKNRVQREFAESKMLN